MHKIDEALYFVIEEKNNQVELTDHGIKFLSGDTDFFFILPILELKLPLSKRKIRKDAEAEERKTIPRFRYKSERIHTLTQLLKAYSLLKRWNM
jgi:preprotein translocase subunit SecA